MMNYMMLYTTTAFGHVLCGAGVVHNTRRALLRGSAYNLYTRHAVEIAQVSENAHEPNAERVQRARYACILTNSEAMRCAKVAAVWPKVRVDEL